MASELCLQICLIIHVFTMILAKEKVSLAALKSELTIGIFRALRDVTEAWGDPTYLDHQCLSSGPHPSAPALCQHPPEWEWILPSQLSGSWGEGTPALGVA